MKDPFVTQQKLEVLKLKVKQLGEYLQTDNKVEPCAHDGYIDDPYLNELICDIHDLHDSISP